MSGKRDSGAMKAAQAVRILALAAEDDFEAAKKKYRKLMGLFHPDSAGAEEPEHVRQEYVRRSQEINEAYRVIREVWESGEWERVRSVWYLRKTGGWVKGGRLAVSGILSGQ